MNEYTKLIISLINEYVNEKRYSFEFVKETCELLLEMKSKEEYKRAKMFGDGEGKHRIKKTAEYPMTYGNETDENVIERRRRQKDEYRAKLANQERKNKPKSNILSIATGDFSMPKESKPEKIEVPVPYTPSKATFKNRGTITVNGKEYNIKISNDKTGMIHPESGDYNIKTININKKDLARKSIDDLRARLTHEIGHYDNNGKSLGKVIDDKIDSALKKYKSSLERNELVADATSAKMIGKDKAIRSLNRSSKEFYRNASKNNTLHNDEYYKLKTRIDFLKSLDKKDIH